EAASCSRHGRARVRSRRHRAAARRSDRRQGGVHGRPDGGASPERGGLPADRALQCEERVLRAHQDAQLPGSRRPGAPVAAPARAVRRRLHPPRRRCLPRLL
ncbi:MAG: hypothetical protein AVDCRST_MAG79-471, partial [uncultured Thermoleophilia bacterium]